MKIIRYESEPILTPITCNNCKTTKDLFKVELEYSHSYMLCGKHLTMLQREIVKAEGMIYNNEEEVKNG